MDPRYYVNSTTFPNVIQINNKHRHYNVQLFGNVTGIVLRRSPAEESQETCSGKYIRSKQLHKNMSYRNKLIQIELLLLCQRCALLEGKEVTVKTKPAESGMGIDMKNNL